MGADGNGLLAHGAILATGDGGQIGLCERHHRGGIHAGAHKELAARIGPLPGHGLRKVVQRVARGRAKRHHDAAAEHGHRALAVIVRDVAGVGGGGNAGVFVGREAGPLAKVRVREHVAHLQRRVLGKGGEAGAGVEAPGAAHGGAHIGQAAGEGGFVVEKFCLQVGNAVGPVVVGPHTGEVCDGARVGRLAGCAGVDGDAGLGGADFVLVRRHQVAQAVVTHLCGLHRARDGVGRGHGAVHLAAFAPGEQIRRGLHPAARVKRDGHVVQPDLLHAVDLMPGQRHEHHKLFAILAHRVAEKHVPALAHPAQHQLARGHGGRVVGQPVHLGGVVRGAGLALGFFLGAVGHGHGPEQQHAAGDLRGVHHQRCTHGAAERCAQG